MAKELNHGKHIDDIKPHPYHPVREVPLGGEDGDVLTNTDLGYDWRPLPYVGILFVESVECLPEVGQTRILYLVKSGEKTEEGQPYDEYFWNSDTKKYELKGHTVFDVSLLWHCIQGKPFKEIGKGLAVNDDKLEIAFEELQ